MSDSGESGDMSDTGDSRTASDMGDSSVFSGWSLVDSHGELGDDETTSTSSSVEVVDDDDTKNSPVTPVAGSPSGAVPRFILRLPSHKQDASDTDEDQAEVVTNETVAKEFDTISSAGVKAGQTYRQSTSEARVSQEQLEELRQTLDTLKRNLQPSQAENCSLSSVELFGSGKSDKDSLKPDSDLLPQRQVENIGMHGTMLDGNLSESSVSSSFSFLSRDADMQNSDGDKQDQDKMMSPPPDFGNSQEEQDVIVQNNPETQTEQEIISPDSETGSRSAVSVFMSQFVQYPVKYIFLAGLAATMGVVLVTVLCIYKQGQDVTTETGALNHCHIDSQKLQIKLDTCDDNLSESKAMIEIKDENIKVLLGEKEELSTEIADWKRKTIKLKGRLKTLLEEDKGVKKTHEELLEENERLQNLVDQSRAQCAEWKQNLDKCSTDSDQAKHQNNLDIENVRYKAEKDVAGVQRQCQADLDKLRSQYQFEIDSVNSRYQSDLDQMRKQYQSDLDQVRNDYQSDLEFVKVNYRSELDRLRIHKKAGEKYTKSHCSEDKKQSGGHCTAEPEDGNGGDTQGTQSVHNTRENKKTGQKEQKKEEEATRRTRPKKPKVKQEKQSRGENQSGGTKQGDKQSYNEHSKKDNSDKKSSKGDNFGSDWADIILDIMNKTKEQIQDTWTKVKNMSESLWQEHQPTLQQLHNSFTKKFQHLSKKFQDKLVRKMNKWFRKGKKHRQQEPRGQQAKTKRRHNRNDDDVTSSNSTIEERLLKLSHQVDALNARKFRKWRESPKVLDIQTEFKQVNILVNKDDQQQMEKSKLTDGYLEWLSCQFRWWKNLDAVAVADDCYLSLCCWQVKVTGGDVKGCGKEKRKHRIVEDSCSLEPVHKPYTSKTHHQNKKTGSTKNKFRKSDHIHRQHFSTGNNDGIMDQEPVSNDQKKDKWFLNLEEERAYQREEPDNWFFRRKHKYVENSERIDGSKDLYEDDFDDDVDDAYYGDDLCDYDLHSGHCFYP